VSRQDIADYPGNHPSSEVRERSSAMETRIVEKPLLGTGLVDALRDPGTTARTLTAQLPLLPLKKAAEDTKISLTLMVVAVGRIMQEAVRAMMDPCDSLGALHRLLRERLVTKRRRHHRRRPRHSDDDETHIGACMAIVACRSHLLKSFNKFRSTLRFDGFAYFLNWLCHNRHIRRRDIRKVPRRIVNAGLDLAQLYLAKSQLSTSPAYHNLKCRNCVTPIMSASVGR
jgi:hypothetical protein